VQRSAIETAARCGLPLVIRSLIETEPLSRIVSAEESDTWAAGLPSAVQAV
jgi:hypothetical protein